MHNAIGAFFYLYADRGLLYLLYKYEEQGVSTAAYR